jgi:cytochrome c-type biogenesis protein CcmH
MLFVITALLLIIVACALAFAPLWRRQTSAALLLTGIFALSVVGIYAWKGTPDALQAYWRDPPKSLEQAIAQTQQTIEKTPQDASLHIELGRLYADQNDYAKSSAAYQKAISLDNSQADWLIESAEAQMRAAADRRMPDDALAQLQSALKKAPQHPRGLLLLGAAYAQRGDAENASATWATLLPTLDDAAANALLNEMNTVRRSAGLADWESGQHTRGLINAEIQWVSTNTPPANAVLFVFARSAEGGMPFAAKRIQSPRFPLNVSLSNSDSPMPTAKLSAQKQVQLQARLSLSGDAQQQSGDLESAVKTVNVGDNSIVVLPLK